MKGETLAIKAEDLTPAGFGAWKHHPATKVFLAFLEDQAQNWREMAMEMWEGGILAQTENPEITSDMIRGRVKALSETAQIGLDDIQTFYAEATAHSQELSEV